MLDGQTARLVLPPQKGFQPTRRSVVRRSTLCVDQDRPPVDVCCSADSSESILRGRRVKGRAPLGVRALSGSVCIVMKKKGARIPKVCTRPLVFMPSRQCTGARNPLKDRNGNNDKGSSYNPASQALGTSHAAETGEGNDGRVSRVQQSRASRKKRILGWHSHAACLSPRRRSPSVYRRRKAGGPVRARRRSRQRREKWKKTIWGVGFRMAPGGGEMLDTDTLLLIAMTEATSSFMPLTPSRHTG